MSKDPHPMDLVMNRMVKDLEACGFTVSPKDIRCEGEVLGQGDSFYFPCPPSVSVKQLQALASAYRTTSVRVTNDPAISEGRSGPWIRIVSSASPTIEKERESGQAVGQKPIRPPYDPERREEAWLTGNRAAWVSLLRTCLHELGYYRELGHEEDPETARARWILEREETIARLRPLCAEFGDNEWDDSHYLADVIEKHLGDHLLAPEDGT